MKQLDQLKQQYPHLSFGQMIVNALNLSDAMVSPIRDFQAALFSMDDSKFEEMLERYQVWQEHQNRPWKTRHSREE